MKFPSCARCSPPPPRSGRRPRCRRRGQGQEEPRGFHQCPAVESVKKPLRRPVRGRAQSPANCSIHRRQRELHHRRQHHRREEPQEHHPGAHGPADEDRLRHPALDQAIKQVRGNGKRVIASFEDPNCGYCKRLAKDLQNLKDATVYTFLYPILSPDSTEKSKNIWCARIGRRLERLDDQRQGPAATGAPTWLATPAPSTRTWPSARRLKVTGPPTIFTADGNRLPAPCRWPSSNRR